MSWLSNLIYGKDPGASSTQNDFAASTKAAGTAASASGARYQADSAAFDPSAAFKEYAGGAYGDFQKQLGLQLRNLSGKAVGAGRFDSGFFDENQGEVVRNLGDDFQSKIAQGALSTAGLREQQIGQEGNYALNQSGQYNDMLAGTLDRETAEANAKRKQRSDFWGGLLNLGGQAIGAAAAGG